MARFRRTKHPEEYRDRYEESKAEGASFLEHLTRDGVVALVLLTRFDWRFAAITFAAVAIYLVFTVSVTEWRMDIRRQANELDSRANTRAIDSLLNYETVKYFNNEEYEARRYDDNLRKYEAAAVKNEMSLGLLNVGQSCVIAIAVTLLMILAAEGVVDKSLTLGDLVLINGLLIQLYIPLNFLGVVYREIKQALIDTDRMFRLLQENREIQDSPGALTLAVSVPAGVAEGDLLLAQVSVRGGTGTTITAPGGWTLVASTTNGTNLRQSIYRHVAALPEPASYTWTFNVSRRASGGISPPRAWWSCPSGERAMSEPRSSTSVASSGPSR